MARGRLIVLEGGEACGKSTQAARLAASLDAVSTREPGGTPLGERIRALLLDPALEVTSARTEALLLLAARAEHVDTVIEPALAAGRDVVCDRFSGSTIAYQGAGRGLAVADLVELSDWAAAGLQPDLVVLLTVPAEVAGARLAARSAARDRVEGAGAAFFDRVAEGFAVQAAADPERWRVVDGIGSPDEVAARILAAIA